MKVGVVIPCFKVGNAILPILESIGSMVKAIYIVDDACPNGTGDLVEKSSSDSRIVVIRHETNQGVGGAVQTGYRRAMEDGCEIIIKLDGDGQMDPGLIPKFVRPIAEGKADYTKGNRFFNVYSVRSMPAGRLQGNVLLSFITKISTGYWKIFDPTNGYTAIHAKVLSRLPLQSIARDYFFESDMLFRLGLIRAKVYDIPMDSVYEDEKSNLRIRRIIPSFIAGHFRNFFKRIIYSYFLRDFQLVSVSIIIGIPMIIFGVVFGIFQWSSSSLAGVLASPGTVMLASLPILIGSQLLIVAIGQDIENQPSEPIHPDL